MSQNDWDDSGLGFLWRAIENIKVAWQTYAILILIGFIVPWGIFVILPYELRIIAQIVDLILGAVGIAGIVKCAAETSSNYAPSAAECVSFGFGKIFTVIFYNLIMLVLIWLVTKVLGFIPFIGGSLLAIINPLIAIVNVIGVINIVLNNMQVVEAIQRAIEQIIYELKNNLLGTIVLYIILIVGGAFGLQMIVAPALKTFIAIILVSRLFR